MAFSSVLKLDSGIFNRSELKRAISRVIVQTAKEFKQSTKDTMTDSPHTGKKYTRRGGDGFTRTHQASRRGERPAPDSGNLQNAIIDRRTGEFSVSVEIDEEVAAYGDILQNKRQRKIMTEDDARIAEKVLLNRSNAAIRNLL